MDSQQILALYEWRPGACFRHPSDGVVETTIVKELHPRSGPTGSVRACPSCVLAMEAKRSQFAEQAGVEYEPGHAGDRPEVG